MCMKDPTTTPRFVSRGYGFIPTMGQRSLCMCVTDIIPLPIRSLLMIPTGLLPGGRGVETPGASKYCAPPGNHGRPLPTCFDLDGWRRTVGIHQFASARRQVLSCEFLQYHAGRRTYILRKIYDVTNGLNYLHTHDVIHGDLKGVSGVPKYRPSQAC